MKFVLLSVSFLVLATGTAYACEKHLSHTETSNVTVTDVCPNLDGSQASIPEGLVLADGQCVPKPAPAPVLAPEPAPTPAPVTPTAQPVAPQPTPQPASVTPVIAPQVPGFSGK